MVAEMLIEAASIGEAVPRPDFDAVVQACFDTAVNLRLQSVGRLVTVLISDHYELPQGVRIKSKSFPLAGLAVGAPAVARGDQLHFDGSALIVDWRKAHTWRCPVRDLAVDMGQPAARSAWSATWHLLNEAQRGENTDVVAEDVLDSGAGSVVSQRLSAPVADLMSAVAKFNADAAILAAAGVVGLGGGLTPSGDDLLMGFLAGLWATAASHRRRLSLIVQLGNGLRRLASQTAEVSATYLWHATQGQFSSSLSDLAGTIGEGFPVDKPAKQAFRVGHSSGKDAVTGLLLGLAAWTPELIARSAPPS